MSKAVPTADKNCNCGFQRKTWFRRNIGILVICALIVALTVLLVTVVLLFSKCQTIVIHSNVKEEKNCSEKNQNTSGSANLSTSLSENETLPSLKSRYLPAESNISNLKLITRLEWLSQPPVEPANPLAVPVPHVIIHHTSTENCSSTAQCIFHVRHIQIFHIESKNWWDIGYNFLVGGDGDAYEGRGWKSEGAHTYGYNARSIGIAFIGTFNSFMPPERQLRACKQLIAKGVELGYVSKDYKLLAARQLQTTTSPGNLLYEELKTWDHWSSSP